MNKFWNFIETSETERELHIDGAIADNDSWFDNDVTPAVFRAELFSRQTPIKLYINSPGGDCVAASQIYTMLMEYPCDVNGIVDGMAASAASVIAMGCTKLSMSPTSLLMIHDPMTFACGNADDMRKAIEMLDEVKESIMNAYEIKTGMSRAKLSHMMESETWLNAGKALELGFCDEILSDGKTENMSGYTFTRHNSDLMNRVVAKIRSTEPKGTPLDSLMNRLNKLEH